MTKIAISEIQKMLGTKHVEKDKDTFIIRKPYFYSFGETEVKLAEYVKEKIPKANIVSMGNHWVQFRGGDSVKKGTHFWVKFTISE